MIRLRGELTFQMEKENIVKQNQGEESRQQNERGREMGDALLSACAGTGSSSWEAKPKLCSISSSTCEHKCWFWKGFSAQVPWDTSQWRWRLWGPPNTGKQGGVEQNCWDPSLEKSPRPRVNTRWRIRATGFYIFRSRNPRLENLWVMKGFPYHRRAQTTRYNLCSEAALSITREVSVVLYNPHLLYDDTVSSQLDILPFKQ